MHDQSYGIIPVIRTGTDYRFLVIHHNLGHWGFPKGHPEGNERPVEAAHRELREETGISDCNIINPTLLEEKYSYTWEGMHIDKRVGYFIGEVTEEAVTVQKEEVQDYAWLSYSESLLRLTHKENKEILRQAAVQLGITNEAQTS